MLVQPRLFIFKRFLYLAVFFFLVGKKKGAVNNYFSICDLTRFVVVVVSI